jgi:hypothetical protein
VLNKLGIAFFWATESRNSSMRYFEKRRVFSVF